MDEKRRLIYTILCAALAFLGAFHVVFSTIFGYGLRQIGIILIVAALFGLFVLRA